MIGTDVERLYKAFLAHVAQTSDSPMGLVVDSAYGCWITTSDGRRYLDLLAGIGVSALGHGNAGITRAIKNQADRHLHVMVYGELVQEQQVLLAERLVGVLPAELETAYFTNSGTEAIEGTLKLVRKATGRSRVLSFRGGFHGDTLGSVSLGGNPLYRDPFEPLLPDVGFLQFNDLSSLGNIDSSVAAVFVEPIQAEAGVVLPEPGFLPALREACSAAGALLVFDEVITGFGRTGHLFAMEHENVTPDVLVLAKTLGGGMPLGAFVTSRRLCRVLSEDPPLGHVTTFGGHPVSCAAGLACLDQIVEERLSERAEQAGDKFAGMISEALPASALSEVRHKGLLLGLEMNSAATAAAFVSGCLDRGLILGWTLHDDRVVRLAPPLVISDAELERAADTMREVIEAIA